jgi:hypothetical protein
MSGVGPAGRIRRPPFAPPTIYRGLRPIGLFPVVPAFATPVGYPSQAAAEVVEGIIVFVTAWAQGSRRASRGSEF